MTETPSRNTGGTTLDGLLDTMMSVALQLKALAAAQGADQTIGTATNAALAAMATASTAAAAAALAEAQKQTALLVEIRDQLKKGILVKTVLAL